MTDFIERYRFYIGGVLILIIVAGVGVIWWDKSNRNKKVIENQELTELQKQNEELRKQLSNQAQKNIAGTSTNDSSDNEDKININTASAEELDKLPGIGPVRAADIIAFRESEGNFQSIEQLKDIKGIGDKSFENLKDLITIGK